jgi:hypothetical protein
LGYWDATSMCGPLTWQIIHASDGFPYRVGNYDSDADLFTSANPRYGGKRPWSGFDPESYDLIRIDDAMMGYDFARIGDLHPGDIVFSFGSPTQWAVGNGNFSHIFVVAGIDRDSSRIAVANMAMNHFGYEDCSISEVTLYTPGDRLSGAINYGWNDHGYGITGRYGFDVFRWKWITYHLEGRSREYSVRWGDTTETIAFDWKVSPESIEEYNHLPPDCQLEPGQVIVLPDPSN